MEKSRIKILCLGYRENSIINFFQLKEYDLSINDKKFSLKEIDDYGPDWIIIYGYRYIVKRSVIERYKNKIINLHISYLPWNRGVSPNLWSFLDDTEKGVTIHYLDEKIDAGDILFQKKVDFDKSETLKTSYYKLRIEIEKLFIENWDKILNSNVVPVKQDLNTGTYHSKYETDEMMKKLKIDSWDINVEKLVNKRTDEEIIGEIQEIRAKNNTYWMDVVRLAFKLAPEEARSIFRKIKQCDHDVNNLLNQLADNDME